MVAVTFFPDPKETAKEKLERIKRLKKQSKRWRTASDISLLFLVTNTALAEHLAEEYPILLCTLIALVLITVVFEFLRSFYAISKLNAKIGLLDLNLPVLEESNDNKEKLRAKVRKRYQLLGVMRHYGRVLLNMALLAAAVLTFGKVTGYFCLLEEQLNLGHVAWVLLTFAVFMFVFVCIKRWDACGDLDLVSRVYKEPHKFKQFTEDRYEKRCRKFWARFVELICKPLMIGSADLATLVVESIRKLLAWLSFSIGALGVGSVKIYFAQDSYMKGAENGAKNGAENGSETDAVEAEFSWLSSSSSG